MSYKILVYNLGAVSTKLGLFVDEEMVARETLNHTIESVTQYSTMREQVEFRKNIIMNWLEGQGVEIDNIDTFALRAGRFIKPSSGGTFLVEGELRKDMIGKYKPDEKIEHPVSISIALAEALMDGRNIPIYVTDPVNTSELLPEARVSGIALWEKDVIYHALNQKMVAREVAEQLGKRYEDGNFIVLHMGGGISVGAHRNGRVIEVNSASANEGCFSPTRAGSLHTSKIVELCYSGKYTKQKLLTMFHEQSGVYSYLGTSDIREVEGMIEKGDEKAALIFNAMAYNVAKQVGGCYMALNGKLDAIIATGGIANSGRMMDNIRARVEYLAPFYVIPGEREIEALVAGALRILRGEEEVAVYGATRY